MYELYWQQQMPFTFILSQRRLLKVECSSIIGEFLREVSNEIRNSWKLK